MAVVYFNAVSYALPRRVVDIAEMCGKVMRDGGRQKKRGTWILLPVVRR